MQFLEDIFVVLKVDSLPTERRDSYLKIPAAVLLEGPLAAQAHNTSMLLSLLSFAPHTSCYKIQHPLFLYNIPNTYL